jgi:hypothetical protein
MEFALERALTPSINFAVRGVARFEREFLASYYFFRRFTKNFLAR